MSTSEPNKGFSLETLARATVDLGPRVSPRLQSGHPWVYRSEIAKISPPVNGPALVDVMAGRKRYLGQGIYNPRSVIAVRLLTRKSGQVVAPTLVRERVRAALAQRSELLGDHLTSACRLVYAEADGLPGLIVDKFGPGLVFQSLAVAAEVCLQPAMEELSAALRPAWIVERNDASVRGLEGLSERRGPWPTDGSPSPAARVEIVENGLRFLVSPLEGQKTGFFLDQRENRSLVRAIAARIAAGRVGQAANQPLDVLDCFSYSGGFAVAAAAALGPPAPLGRLMLVDSSEAALELARDNLALNGRMGAHVEFNQGNAFDVLRGLHRGGRRDSGFDLIILDPPPFARERRMLEGALRGYKEINLRAMHLLRPGGVLVTCTCSHHMSRELFQGVLVAAATDTGDQFRMVAATGHPADHPVLLSHPEGDYLRCVVLEKAIL